MKKFKIYAKSILIALVINGIVGFITSKFMDYNNLVKPPLAPPGILFPIIWVILFILMGISYGMLKTKSLVDSKTKTIYYLQLFVNALWSIFFFVFKWRFFAFIWLIFLIILILIMIINFYKKDKISAYIQLPYLIWSIFAAYLNIAIYLLNS